MSVPNDVQELIEACYEANPYYMEQMIHGMRIMPARKEKYSGSDDPYTNFKLEYFRMRLLNPTIDMHFLFFAGYVGLKDNRLMVNQQDFEDDSLFEGIRDESNYLGLYGGAIRQKREEDARAKEVGYHQVFDWSWIEQTTNQWNFHNSAIEERDSGLKVVRHAHQAEALFNSVPDDDNPYWPAVSVDWNGVLDQYKGWNGYVETYPLDPNAVKMLQRLQTHFNTIILHTATVPIDLAVEWVEENMLTDLISIVTNWKLPADAYIDDRAVLHTGDHEDTAERAIAHRAHWEEHKEDG